ncbi:MAG: hypothetical protein DMG33_14265 [Acidobacteria bacterium]|nr:MAG: hypothetical protein DMG33_14265 [Acidobacteriota bacterium]
MAPEDRDRTFEKALARHLLPGEQPEACPDADTLAAYHELELPAEERFHWKMHILACARCQEILVQLQDTDHIPTGVEEAEDIPVFNVPVLKSEAIPEVREPLKAPEKPMPEPALAGVAPAAPAAPRAAEKVTEMFALSRQRAKSWRWLVPAGAIAAGLLVWVTVHPVIIVPRSEEVALNPPQTTNAPAASAASTPPSNVPIPGAVEDSGHAMPEDKRAGDVLVENAETRARANPPVNRQDKTSDLDAFKTRRAEPAAGDRETLDSKKAPTHLAKISPAAPAAPLVRSRGILSEPTKEELPVEQESNMVAKVAGAPEQAPPPAPPPPSAASKAPPAPEAKAQEKDKAAFKADALSETVTVAPLTAIARAAQIGVQKAGSPSSRTIRTPDGKTVWILGDHGVILRSSDGGTSWASQSSGLSASLLAGSAPSEMVCWVVGKQGSVLLTTDGGEHWQKIASPTSEDLIGVSARDAQNAAIWSDPSLPRYVTHDGGKNWQQSATN